jgi:hypothetical protein
MNEMVAILFSDLTNKIRQEVQEELQEAQQEELRKVKAAQALANMNAAVRFLRLGVAPLDVQGNLGLSDGQLLEAMRSASEKNVPPHD